MNTFERLENEACNDGIEVINHYFKSNKIKGLYCDGTVALSNELENSAEKTTILAEELGHHYTTAGDIIDQKSINNRKQELRARLWAYNKLIGLQGILSAYKANCLALNEMAEHLEVSEEFLSEALDCYRKKYGICTKLDNYTIYFEPHLGIIELI